ncbi:hypothetical protein DMJ13_19720 [halophilic archaeon]|nr:hypothetical protein DMJ13_19720 [halophilic archaeon]
MNMVEAGADPEGNEDVVPVIEQELQSDTLLYFPQGRYKMNSQVSRRGETNLGLIGNSAVLAHGEVNDIKGFTVTEGEFEGKAQHFKIGSGGNPHNGKFVFGGFTMDWRGENTGMQILNHHTTGVSEIANVRQLGVHDLGCQGPFRANPATKDAKIQVRNVDIRYGGLTYQKTINERTTDSGGGGFGRSWATSGITMHPQTKGYLRVQNMYVGGWPDNGIYLVGGSKTRSGTVEVVNSVAANSHASNIRIGGQNSKIANCTVVTDEKFSKHYFEQRPIRLDNGSCSIKNTQIIQKKPTGWSITVQHAVEKAVLNNISIAIYNTPMTALVIDPAADSVVVKNVDIKTPGWPGSRPMLIQGSGDVMQNISVS